MPTEPAAIVARTDFERRLAWLIRQRWWMVPLYVSLQLCNDLVDERPTHPIVPLSAVALLAANAAWSVMLRRGFARRIDAALQVTGDILVSTTVIVVNVDPRDSVAFGLLVCLVVSSLVLHEMRRLTFVGIAAILLILGLDVARLDGDAWVHWVVSTAIVATVALLGGYFNVRRADLHFELARSYEELARAQAQLVQRAKMAALGELSAMVAHEVRNALGVIFNATTLLRRQVDPDAAELVGIVGEEAERLNRMVAELLEFARPRDAKTHVGPLAPVIEDALAAALPPGLRERIHIVSELSPDAPAVRMDAQQIRQALVNLLLNAAQAMPAGGTITVRLRRDEGAGGVRLEVADTGAGVDREVRDRIFEPFVTTKPLGTGLGLALVKRIVEHHAGRVSVVTEPGTGTTFAIELPAVPGFP